MQHQWFPHSVASCQRYFQKFYHGRIINVNFSLSIHRRSHGVMVSTLDFESSDPSSNLGGTYFYFSIFLFLLIFLLQLSIFLLLNFYFTVFRHKSNELLINTIFYFILIKSGRLPTHADSFPVLSHYQYLAWNWNEFFNEGDDGKDEGRDSPLLAFPSSPRA